MRCLRGFANSFMIFGAFFLIGFQLKYFIILRGQTSIFDSKEYRDVQKSLKAQQLDRGEEPEQRKKNDTVIAQAAGQVAVQQGGLLLQHAWQPFVDKHKFRYMANNIMKCFDQKKRMFDELTMIVIVESDPGHFARRDIMRTTWIHDAMEKRYSIMVMFLLGLASDPGGESEDPAGISAFPRHRPGSLRRLLPEPDHEDHRSSQVGHHLLSPSKVLHEAGRRRHVEHWQPNRVYRVRDTNY